MVDGEPSSRSDATVPLLLQLGTPKESPPQACVPKHDSLAFNKHLIAVSSKEPVLPRLEQLGPATIKTSGREEAGDTDRQKAEAHRASLERRDGPDCLEGATFPVACPFAGADG